MSSRKSTKTLAVLAAAGLMPGTAGTASAFTACQVTDTGGVDDKSFNETAWKGVQDAQTMYGVEARLLESKAETDYAPNLNSFVAEGCDLIIAVGFLMGDATKEAAEANPDAKFTIIDYAYDPTMPNILGQLFATDQAAFLAGYVAAGTSKTGIVGTFGGINIPPVTGFMDGFAWGVDHYNKTKGADVQVLGWDPAAREGLFTNNFDSLDDGRAFAQNLYDEGADIVMPVAGPVGLGSAALADELGTDKLMIIGVDADQTRTDPAKRHVYLTSVLKNMDATVAAVIDQTMKGSYAGGITFGTLENGGVGIAPYHDLASAVPAELAAEVEALRQGIIDGSVKIQ